MSLHPAVPASPCAPLIPGQRWFPADEALGTCGFIWAIETKGRTELDLPQKMARLKQRCADATAAEENGQRNDFIFVDQESFEKHKPTTLFPSATSFVQFKATASNH